MKNKDLKYSLVFCFLLLILIFPTINAFSVEKYLIQTEIDQNYPCHLEGRDTIVCPALTQIEIDNWDNYIKSIPDMIVNESKVINNPDKDKGKLTDKVKSDYLLGKVTLYQKKGYSTSIDITRKYTEKVNLNYLNSGDEIKIGFATNTFQVVETPLENFIVNTGTGMVHYNPLSNTWLNFFGRAISSDCPTISVYTNRSANLILNNTMFAYSVWFNMSVEQIRGGRIFGVNDEWRDNAFNYDNHTLTSGIQIGITNTSNTVFNTDFNTTRVYFYTNSSNASRGSFVGSTAGLKLNQWYNVVGVFNGSTCLLYIDGVLNNTAPCQTMINSTLLQVDSTLEMGYTIGGFSNHVSFNGTIDELRLYKRNLSQAEITQIYNSGRTINMSLPSDSLILYFPLNENQGNYTYGRISGYNGTFESCSLQRKPEWKNDGINVTTLNYYVNISLVNITKAYIYWDNGTVWNGTDTPANNFTGNASFSFLNNQTVWILENYDYIYPIFSEYGDNNGTINASEIAIFNITILKTNGTAWLTINNLNYTAQNLTSNTYNVTVNLTSSGSYSYYWGAYGNGTSNLYNSSDSRTFVVNSYSTPSTIDNNKITDPLSVSIIKLIIIILGILLISFMASLIFLSIKNNYSKENAISNIIMVAIIIFLTIILIGIVANMI